MMNPWRPKSERVVVTRVVKPGERKASAIYNVEVSPTGRRYFESGGNVFTLREGGVVEGVSSFGDEFLVWEPL